MEGAQLQPDTQFADDQYYYNRTRPDLEFAVIILARFASNPSTRYWMAIQRFFRYLVGTTSLGITYGGSPTSEPLMGYSDADFAGDMDHRKSTSSFVFRLGNGPVAWKSRRQRTVTLSSIEAEYAALTEAIWESASLRQLLTEI
jgi:hypothetical protein